MESSETEATTTGTGMAAGTSSTTGSGGETTTTSTTSTTTGEAAVEDILVCDFVGDDVRRYDAATGEGHVFEDMSLHGLQRTPRPSRAVWP